MKRILAFFCCFAVICGICEVNAGAETEPVMIAGSVYDCAAVRNVSATANHSGNTDKSWISASTAAPLENDLFEAAHVITCKGTTAVPSTNQFRMTFTGVPQIALGDYCYLSFYYRVNGAEENDEYKEVPPKFQVSKFGLNSGNTIGAQDTSVFHKWKKVTAITQMETAVTNGSMYLQLGFLKPSTPLNPYKIEFANINFIWFGVPAGETDTEKELTIKEYLDNASFSEVTFDGKKLNLEKNPEKYIGSVMWDGEEQYEITAKDFWGNETEIALSGDKLPLTATATAYAKNYDFTAPDESLKKTYTLEISPYEADFTVSFDKDIGDIKEAEGGDKIILETSFFNFELKNKDYFEIIAVTEGNKTKKIFVKRFTVDASETFFNDVFEAELPEGDYSSAKLNVYIVDAVKLTNICS